jgi:hypothetical protein
MPTHPITRPTSAHIRHQKALRERAALAEPPDTTAWFALLCRRCDRFFRVQGIASYCARCVAVAASAGIVGSEWIGEVSGC